MINQISEAEQEIWDIFTKFEPYDNDLSYYHDTYNMMVGYIDNMENPIRFEIDDELNAHDKEYIYTSNSDKVKKTLIFIVDLGKESLYYSERVFNKLTSLHIELTLSQKFSSFCLRDQYECVAYHRNDGSIISKDEFDALNNNLETFL